MHSTIAVGEGSIAEALTIRRVISYHEALFGTIFFNFS